MTIAIGRSFWWVATPPMQQVTPTRGIRGAHGGAYGSLWVESLGDFHKSVVLQEKQDLKKISGGFLCHTTYRKNNNLKKWAGMRLNGFHIK